MLFNSHEFVFLFFPLTLLGYGLCIQFAKKAEKGMGRKLPGLFLLVMSFVFYAWNGPEYLPILLGSMVVNFIISRKRKLLVVGLFFHLGMLCCFKYLDQGGFFPLAISFYTFSQIAFLVECYRGNVKNRDPLSYGVYVAYFPKMIQGPIALPEELCWEQPRVSWEEIYRNLYLFVLGLFKKVLIADTFGKAVELGYGNLAGLNSADAILVMLAYTLQLYFDFSGYCDMAMGISGMLGIALPVNFRSPYKAANILEFWKGWHITLTRFFTKYVYIPLGGNRKGRGRMYFNTLLVFFLSGIWHGTGVQFLIWGMLHGVLYVLTRMCMDAGWYKHFQDWRERQAKGVRAVFHGLAVFLTFLYVNVAWVFFRAPSVKEAGVLLGRILNFQGGRLNWELAGCYNLDEFWYVIKVLHIDRWQYAHYICMFLIFAGTLLLVFFGKTAVDYVKTVKPKLWHSILMAVLFLWSVLSFSGVSSFLYVNF